MFIFPPVRFVIGFIDDKNIFRENVDLTFSHGLIIIFYIRTHKKQTDFPVSFPKNNSNFSAAEPCAPAESLIFPIKESFS